MDFFFIILLRILWQMTPTFFTCAVFWAGAAFMEYQFIRTAKKINWWTRSLALTGVSMNALVTLANNGTMPILGDPKKFHPMSLWVPGTGKHLLFLCDRFDGGIALLSLGDLFLIGAFLITILLWLHRIINSSSSLSSGTPKIP